MTRKRRHIGFTLVELLVVLGIIALLVSMLLPALNKARQQAVIVQCGSNIRQLAVMCNIYATQNKGRVPMGYTANLQYSNYMLYRPPPFNAYQLWGAMYVTGIIKDPKAMYCPAEMDPTYQYKTPVNVWPPATTNTIVTRIGYGFRCNMDWGYGGYPLPVTGKFLFPRLFNVKGRQTFIAEVMIPISALGSTGVPAFQNRHKTGQNVSYSDGSVQYIPTKVWKANYLAERWLQETNKPYYGVWIDFDEYR
jgi:prepilin-type N-terminal cleavage/methylation domain-containing protein